MNDVIRNSSSKTSASPAAIDASASTNVVAGLAPLVAIVFLGFLAVGAPLAALSIYVHASLGFSTIVVGWVIGIQSVVTVLTRHWAGGVCDHHGPRRAVLLGLPLAMASGMFYLASALVRTDTSVTLGLLLIGRIIIGLGESLFMTGTMSWGIARFGSVHTGKVMSWQGIAMYAALGVGAPLGLAVQASFGFIGVAVLTIVAPLIAALIAMRVPAVPASGSHRVPFYRVVGLIWQPGLILTLATVPFATMATFLALDFVAHGWTGAGVALAGFAVGYIAVRLVGSHWPDRFGGTSVAAVSLAIEAIGQAMLWLAARPDVALAGAVLTGLGFSLVFPSMGVEATRRVKPELRGRAVGNFIAFFDVALGLTGPLVGLFVAFGGYAAAFMIGTISAVAALAVLFALSRRGGAP